MAVRMAVPLAVPDSSCLGLMEPHEWGLTTDLQLIHRSSMAPKWTLGDRFQTGSHLAMAPYEPRKLGWPWVGHSGQNVTGERQKS